MKKIFLILLSFFLLLSANTLAKVSSFDVKLEPRTVSV
jgi:hypothetical protein